jgi:hypothetical protein
MQVKVIREPIRPADLYQSCDVLVLPIFVDSETYEAIAFDCQYRRRVIFNYLKSRNVTFIGLPDNVAVLFLGVSGKHSKRSILKHVLHLYRAAVQDDFGDFDVNLKGLRNIFVTSASDEPPSEYLMIPKSIHPLIIYSGDSQLDRIFRTMIRQGAFEKYTADNLAHPTVRSSFCRMLNKIGREKGFDLEVITLIRHRRKVFVTCDVMELEAS